jgi:transcriptional regulator with XRE-family HTH domain
MPAVQDREITQLVGANIRAAREEAGISQEALAAAAGINRAGLGKIERGEVETKLLTVMKVAGVLRRDLGDLVPEAHWTSEKVSGHWE